MGQRRSPVWKCPFREGRFHANTREMETPFGDPTPGLQRRRRARHRGRRLVALARRDVSAPTGEYVVELEVPGFDEQELRRDHDHERSSRARAKEEMGAAERTALLREWVRRFERTFELPLVADTVACQCLYGEGVLDRRRPEERRPVSRHTTQMDEGV